MSYKKFTTKLKEALSEHQIQAYYELFKKVYCQKLEGCKLFWYCARKFRKNNKPLSCHIKIRGGIDLEDHQGLNFCKRQKIGLGLGSGI